MNLRLTITVATPEITPIQLGKLVSTLGIGGENVSRGHNENKHPMIIGTFAYDTTAAPQYALQQLVDRLQKIVLEQHGRYLVTAKGVGIVETPVSYSNDWIILTDEERKQRHADELAAYNARQAAEKAKLIAKLRKMNVAKVLWSVYWENDQNETEDTTLLDSNDNDISDEETYGGAVYDELLDFYDEAIDDTTSNNDKPSMVGIDTGSYELHLLDGEGKEIEELHYTGEYYHSDY